MATSSLIRCQTCLTSRTTYPRTNPFRPFNALSRRRTALSSSSSSSPQDWSSDWHFHPSSSSEQHEPHTSLSSDHPEGQLDLETMLFNAVHLGPLLKRIEAVQRGELIDEHIQQALLDRPELPKMQLAAFLAGSKTHTDLANWHEAQWARLHELHHKPAPATSSVDKSNSQL